MNTENFEQLFKLNKMSAPIGELNKMTTEIFKRISEQNLELMEEQMERVSSQVKRLSSIKSPEELINLQKECLSENINAGMEATQKIMQMGLEHFEEITKVLGSTTAKMSEKAVEKTRKYTEKTEK